ncbi:hypothetical protein [Hyphomicrobium sp. DMF-1]|uniref:hypothetical protein n=1 Tax=Hyphomicrobium sp. DMF-1 TaxID=3019544 RepID=UPI0022EC137E|nr:hypothetical protein [Hyphomicrobium sp. DMF-1]WBT40170.1 hypothetical protein PE058_09890 [Hyphomicrobium sp. DMF-1]
MTAWYRAGTVTATNGSTTVTGALTAWLANAKAGDVWCPDADGRGYEITAVGSNTSITIYPAYAGTTGSGKAYGIARFSTNWNSVSDIGVSLAEILAAQTNILAGNGVPSDSLGQDGDVYFRQDVAEYYTKGSGTWTLVTALIGPQGPAGPSYQATSTSSVAIGTGAKTFTVQSGRGYSAGQWLRVSNSSSNYMEGTVTSYSSTTLIINVPAGRAIGSGTFTSWNVNIAGDIGPANSLAIGSVTTGAAGSSASATITGTAPSQTLNLVIPRGNTGVAGDTGPQGSTGAAATITVGTVDTVDPDDPATVTNSGTSGAAVFDFEIPKGDPGTPINHRGDYNGATTYALNDAVRVLGSTWVYINATPGSGNAPPTLPTESNSYWQLMAQAGSNGTGAVDLVNGQSGVVVLDGSDIEANHTATNYTPAGSSVADHLAAVDTELGNVFAPGSAPNGTMASAATVDIGASSDLYLTITGTTTITSFGTVPNQWRVLTFSGALTLTHNTTTLKLPGNDLIRTEAGDVAVFASDASGNWTCLSYTRRRQRPRGNLLSDFAISLFADNGRFAGNVSTTEVSAFTFPNYIQFVNGGTASNYGKFITNNNDYGGSAGSLATEVKTLIDKVKDSGYRRYGVEFFVAQITAGSGTANAPVVIGGTTFYYNALLSFGPRPPAMTFRAHIRALDAAIAYIVQPGQTAYKNGVRQSGNFRIEVADGWVHVLIFDEQTPRTSFDYNPTPYSIYCASSGHRYLIACPALMGGLVEVDSNVLVVPSVNRWLV